MRAAAVVALLACRVGCVNLGHQGGWVRTAPRHEYGASCWLMKARYNCQNDTRSPPADAWAHVQNRATNATWRDFVGARGGHLAAARAHRRSANRTRTNVVLMGNSYLRQVFEAMACRWDATITAGLLQVRGPEMHIEDIAAQKRTSVADRGFRSLPFGDVARPSCHGNDAERYYALGVAPSVAGCNDNLAMVEFAKDLRAYFVFRPWSYEEDAIDVLRALDLKARDVDVLVCNEYCGLVAPPKRAFGLTTEEAVLGERRDAFRAALGRRSGDAGPTFVDFDRVRATLKAQMKRDVGHAYGATNAVLRDDNHPCLPGIPDDEVDILFSALADRGHAQRLGYVPAHKEEFWRAPPPEDARRATSTTKAPELKGRCGRAALAEEKKCNKKERCKWVFGSHACMSDCTLKNEEECDKKHHCTYNEKRGCKPKKHEAPSR